jgi:3-phosphoshikimate 1-carboxyvinyltransferase
MKQRPIGILLDALRTLGAEIEYTEKEGFPPVKTKGFNTQKTNQVSIRGDVSSQYISALMMVAPALPQGIEIKFSSHVTSVPYIEMTASLMRQFGAVVEFSKEGIKIPAQSYKPAKVTIESDWSAASYWFAFAALAKEATITLPNMTLRSLQGDKVIMDMMEVLGVKCEPKGNSLQLIKAEHHESFSWDFTHCPDLAQTIAVVCAAKGITGIFTGLESLRIKETDRILALQNELRKINARLTEEDGKWILAPGTLPAHSISINTYLDHRMAMAFAPLATMLNITIENPEVVKKSYPDFWEDVLAVGCKAAITSLN